MPPWLPRSTEASCRSLTQRAVLQLRLRRLAGRVQQREDVLAVEAARLRFIRGGGDLRGREAVQFLHIVDDDGRGVHLIQHVLAELRAQLGELGVHLLEARLVRLGQLRAGAHEILVVALDEPQLLGVELQRGALVVERLDAREQLGVQVDRVVVRGRTSRRSPGAACCARRWCPRRRG